MSVSIRIIDGPLGPEPGAPAPTGTGARLVFEGLVRPLEEGSPIAGLDYEAYRPMAENQLEALAGEMVASHSLLGIEVEHSVGTVPAGACSFRLIVFSEHRAESLAAADEFIVRMKQDVPLWKRPVD